VSVTLATIVARLKADVPARSSVPTDSQYEQAVKDAVADYSRRRPMQKVTELAITNGTADYTLPNDFLFVIKLEDMWSPDGVLVTNAGLVPVSSTYEEYYTLAGLTMTFHPTPTYTTSRTLRYAAAHVLNNSDAYVNMTDDDVRILIHKAKALVLSLQARSAAISGEMAEYQIGDERVKRVPASESLKTAAAFEGDDYEKALEKAIGPVGMRSHYNWMGR
jgi:hypothetical protein